ncbi:MAG: Bro-N domain-containing protein [Candidatus Omnitrophica bacterium]|nr:Bro-N domain-containing protein [Candidatus Omnitrophota bacterium]MBU4303098.1 Bro-N domain-containing protein [Candidatus Omnitrophota bacterium]MBU4418415.1 Bro-N domain-containing protein [Candidatus Omnitrophota bacterium]MBU4468219.1 Bro-N domain-containing protein [Candidatus Omnitrophota bacterium]MCG2707263.1 Bro-N domain-containing protein [Candidatus Omnitrophota bacterium]
MKQSQSLAFFHQNTVRRHWDGGKDLWYFSIVDVVSILSESTDGRNYWKVLKHRLKEEGSEVVTKCNQLKMQAADGKLYLTDAADTETLFRLIQSIPSPKAEPFKLWLAQVGYERVEETEDPELAMERAMKTYLKKGYTKEWINQRLKSIEVRKDLTDEWQERGMKEGVEYAILTDEITKAWADRSVKDYKKLKNLKKQNLRDNLTNLELVLNMLAEVSTTAISKKKQPKGLPENQRIARQGGMVAGKARKEIERRTGESVITGANARALAAKESPKVIREKVKNGP